MTDTAGTAHTRASTRVSRPPRLSATTCGTGPDAGRASGRRRFPQVTRSLGLPVLLAVAVTAAAPGFVDVRAGDTLSHIAQRNGITVAELQRINGMGASTRIFAGQELRVSGSGGASGDSSSGSSRGSGKRHRIAQGETLSGIAAQYGLSRQALASANGLSSSTIYAGRTLVIPSGSGGGSEGSGTATRSRRSSTSSVSRAEVRQIIRDTARRYGVDPSLALAIADQESGFQQNVVSSANAIGVMQVLPSTVDWMERVVGRDLDAYDVRDNVTAGVALLKVLRSQANVEDTIAAYYQGLRAVREHGWYEETKSYVANVRALQRSYS